MKKALAHICAIVIAIVTPISRADTADHNVEAGAPTTLAAVRFLSVPGADYKLVWNDEFNGSSLDPTRWTTGLPWKGSENGHWHNDEYASYMTDDDVSVSDGMLHLTCRRKEIQGLKHNFHFTEGFVHTSGKFTFTYGYAESRCRAPMDSGPGMWPAFWTLAPGWPPEFDIIELWTAEPRIHQGYAFRNPAGGVSWKSYHKRGMNLAGYHNYGMEWGPGYIFFNVDGVVNNRVFGGIVTSKPQYLILNSGVGSGKGNVPPNERSVFPNSFDVDYCRVYQRATSTPIVQNSGFEFDQPAPWSSSKLTSVVTRHTHTGTQSLRVEPGGSSEQKLFGLKPNTAYTLTAWSLGERSVGRIGVKDFGGEELKIDANNPGMMQTSLSFTTGPSNETAVIYCQNAGNAGAAYFDDIALIAGAR